MNDSPERLERQQRGRCPGASGETRYRCQASPAPTLLIPRIAVLLEKLIVAQLIKIFPVFNRTQKIHYRIEESSPPAPILGQINPVHTLSFIFL
jgi:hypothetical protein